MRPLLTMAAAVGAGLVAGFAAILLTSCGLTPAQDATIARAWVTAACTTVETVDPAIEANGLVELVCPPSPPTPAPDAAPAPTVTVVFQRVVVSKAAWRDTLHGTQAISAPAVDAGGGG